MTKMFSSSSNDRKAFQPPPDFDFNLPSWSFENANHVISKNDLALKPAILAYLATQDELLSNPLNYFANTSLKTNPSTSKTEKYNLDLESMKYLSEKCNVNLDETIRICHQTNQRRLLNLYENLLSHDDNSNKLLSSSNSKDLFSKITNPKNLVYSSEILKEKRQFIKLITLLFENKNELLSSDLRYYESILISSDAILKFFIDEINAAYHLIISDSSMVQYLLVSQFQHDMIKNTEEYFTFVRALTSIFKKELSAYLSDLLSLIIQILIPVESSIQTSTCWFNLMKSTLFLSCLWENPNNTGYSYLYKSGKLQMIIISLLILGLTVDRNCFDENAPQFKNKETFLLIHSLMTTNMVTFREPNRLNGDFDISLLIYSWCIILQIKYFLCQQEELQDFLQILCLSSVEEFKKIYLQPAMIYCSSSLSSDPSRIFTQFIELYECLKFNEIYVIIIICFFKILLPFLNISSSNTRTSATFTQFLQCLVSRFSDKDDFLQTIFVNFEDLDENDDSFSSAFLEAIRLNQLKAPSDIDSLISLLTLLSIDAQFADITLSNSQTYLHFFKLGDFDYEYVTTINTDTTNSLDSTPDSKATDENNNLNRKVETDNTSDSAGSPAIPMDTVTLKHSINIKPPFEDIFSNNYFQIPQGTQGKLILHNKNHIRNNNEESNKNEQMMNENHDANGIKTRSSKSALDTPMNAIIFDFKYNGWSMLGKIFENLIHSLAMMTDSNENALDMNETGEFNSILDNTDNQVSELLLSILRILISVFSTVSNSQCLEIIKQIEQPIVQSSDFFDLIFKLLTFCLKFKAIGHLTLINKLFIVMMKRDTELEMDNSKTDNSSCFSFVNMVWTIIIKANYFNNGIIKYDNFGSNLLLDLILVKEKSQGKFQFTSSLIELSNYLIDDTLAVKLKNTSGSLYKDNGNELVTNYGNFDYNTISLKVKQDTVIRVVSICINFFENFVNWNFENQEERFHLGNQVLLVFSKIISVTYSVQQKSSGDEKKNPLKSSADEILNSFLHNNELGTLTTKPIIFIIENLTNITDSHICTSLSDIVSINYSIFVRTLFDFTKLLISLKPCFISINNNGNSDTFLEVALASKLKQILQIYMKFPDLKINVISLITALIRNNFCHTQKEEGKRASSLLSQLGNNYSMILLNCLVIDLEGSLIPFSLKTALYNFFSNIMQTNQEGLSILLLAGNNSLDKKSFTAIQQKKSQAANSENKSILKILKENVKNLKNYPDSVAIYLLDAISYTLNSWSIAQRSSDNDEEFINSLTNYFIENFKYLGSESVKDKRDVEIKDAEFDDLSAIVNKSVTKCYKVELLASIERILALYLYNNPSEKTIQPILNLMQDERFLKEYASRLFKVKDYKYELHLKTYKNFEKQLSGYKLSQYIMNSNSFNGNQYGVGCIYNLALIDRQFRDNLGWKDYSRRDVILSDLNIQYAAAQTNLIKSSGALVTSYIKYKSYDSKFDFFELATILLNLNNNDCLAGVASVSANSISLFSFRQIYLERIELTFFLVYTFFQHIDSTSSKLNVNNSINDERIFKLFEAISNSLLSEEVNFLVSLTNQDFHIYRSLLRILVITLRLCSTKAHLLEKLPSLLIDLFAKVVANGSTVVISCIQGRNSNNGKRNNHSDGDGVSVLNSIEDLLLLISIFKAFASINFSTDITATFASLLDINGTIKYIMELYTYANSMLIEGQPVFADLSLIYISEMIAVNIVAEKFLSYGLFSILNNSAVSIVIQKGNIRVDTKPRYHYIWANGLLNIVLTLLSKFGPRVIPETCTFLKNFEKQIASTLQNWTTKSMVINQAVIDETNKLILLHKALSLLSYKEYIGVSNYGSDNEEIEFFPGLETMKQRKTFTRSLNYLLTHPKYFQSRITADINDFGFDNETESENIPPSRTKLANNLGEDVKLMIEILENDKAVA